MEQKGYLLAWCMPFTKWTIFTDHVWRSRWGNVFIGICSCLSTGREQGIWLSLCPGSGYLDQRFGPGGQKKYFDWVTLPPFSLCLDLIIYTQPIHLSKNNTAQFYFIFKNIWAKMEVFKHIYSWLWYCMIFFVSSMYMYSSQHQYFRKQIKLGNICTNLTLVVSNRRLPLHQLGVIVCNTSLSFLYKIGIEEFYAGNYNIPPPRKIWTHNTLIFHD